MLPPGTAPIKAEYLLSTGIETFPDDDAAEGAPRPGVGRPEGTSNYRSRRPTKQEKKDRQGSNKGRRFGKIRDELDLCWKIAKGSTCEFGAECRFNHDIQSYLAEKPRDIRWTSEISNVAPFISAVETVPSIPEVPSLDLSTKCPVFAELGECKYGFKCRFLGDHVKRDDSDGSLVVIQDEDAKSRAAVSMAELNFISPDTQKLLRSKKYKFPVADAYLKEVQIENDLANAPKATLAVSEPEQQDVSMTEVNTSSDNVSDAIIEKRTAANGSQEDTADVPTRFNEKKRLQWAGKTYLAPLTTVGNLPFRRLCVKYGADITCGEMGLATSFLTGSKEEWSLVRRHPSERTFGVQLAGAKPNTLVPTAEVLAKECPGTIDFVDINCGCPIDLVFNTGSGSALLDAPGKLGKIITGMNKALGEIPVTVKLRTGVKDGRNTADKLMSRLTSEWNVGCISLHGRTRQQRYTKLADWDYIKRCVEAVRAKETDEDLPPVPIFGGGDCFSSQDYWSSIENYGVDGVMVARGALIKPWIFTEIKEHREWDISARERLDMVKQYAEYGLCHFGSDTAGINATRRYLCEALSFTYRYVPIGLLERLPGRLNERAPAYRGRDELETLLASSDSRDWVKISEMFLGPAPESWTFTPKHKSNSFESQG
ncbi:zinc finger dihydrouridine synthase [Mycena floridula]|nr:zinc finger dihydrouridine synthase [Mycena floridula]